MLNKQRRRRIWALLGFGSALVACMAFILYTLRDNIVFYRTPSELSANPHWASSRRPIRVGALVAPHSFHTLPNGHYAFELDDGTHRLMVHYRGLLPSLFAEGRGAVAEGRLHADGIFHATTILAKHDATYRAPVK